MQLVDSRSGCRLVRQSRKGLKRSFMMLRAVVKLGHGYM